MLALLVVYIHGGAGVAAFQKGRRCLDEDLSLQPSIQAGYSISTLAKSPM